MICIYVGINFLNKIVDVEHGILFLFLCTFIIFYLHIYLHQLILHLFGVLQL